MMHSRKLATIEGHQVPEALKLLLGRLQALQEETERSLRRVEERLAELERKAGLR